MFLRLSSATLILALSIGAGPAQEAALPVISWPWPAASGTLANSGSGTAAVWATTVTLPGAASMQLAFGETALDSDQDFVLVLDPASDERQRLDRLRLRQWSHHTAWFNSASLIVELHLAPGSLGSVWLDHAMAGLVTPGPDPLCDGDDRLPSGDDVVCRFVSSTSSGAAVSSGFILRSNLCSGIRGVQMSTCPSACR